MRGRAGRGGRGPKPSLTSSTHSDGRASGQTNTPLSSHFDTARPLVLAISSQFCGCLSRIADAVAGCGAFIPTPPTGTFCSLTRRHHDFTVKHGARNGQVDEGACGWNIHGMAWHCSLLANVISPSAGPPAPAPARLTPRLLSTLPKISSPLVDQGGVKRWTVRWTNLLACHHDSARYQRTNNLSMTAQNWRN